jgi:mono/diheme cytochrome c family protein
MAPRLVTLVFGGLVLALAGGGVIAQQPPAGQAPPADPASCKGMLARTEALPGLLSAVPRYRASYVLVVPERLAAKVPGPDAPGMKEIEVGVQSGTPGADAARAIGVAKTREYPLALQTAIQPLRDIKDGKLDAAILWAPLAGLGIIELELDGQVAIYTVDKPREAPALLRAAATPGPCANAVLDVLDANGVLPAELLTTVDLRTIIGRKPPAFDLEQARAGRPVYNQYCSKCHGPEAVADPAGLAPVDLRITTSRLSYSGFVFIILNGRPERSMPPLRGTISEEEIALIYQYLKARIENRLPGSSQ